MTDETTEGGSKIFRHGAVDRPAGVADMDGEALEAIDQHLRTFIGDPANVFHEIVSETVHIDVHIISPSKDRDCYTLVTTGMSDLPMAAPSEELRYAELLLALPSTWTPGPLWEADLKDESLYWPIRLLKGLARLPHTYNTWLGTGHTIPNGDPPEPYAPGTEFCCALILRAFGLPREFATLTVRPEKTVNFYAVVPIYSSEMQFKLKKGSSALVEGLLDASVTELIDPRRRVAGRKRRFLLFRRD